MREKILIADDEFLIRRSLEGALSKEGYIVKAVEDGERAIEAIECEKFDYVITDLKMPYKDGWEVLEYARERCPRSRVIIITSSGEQETESKAKEKGAYGFIEKQDIMYKIKLLLRGIHPDRSYHDQGAPDSVLSSVSFD